jgi:apolipoprotein N-acyltransferase
LNYLLALVSGFFLVLIFPRFNVTWLAPVALTPLLVALMREGRPRRRLLLGYITGLVYWFGVNYWIQFVLSVHGGVGDAAGWALLLLFCLAKAAQMAMFGWVAGAFLDRWWAVPAVSALWVALEISHEYTGFAWLPLGNAGVEMSLPMRLAPFTGVYGLSFVFMMMASALALAIMRRPRIRLAWLVALPLLILLPPLPGQISGTETAVLLQPNVSETEQWTGNSLEQAERELALLSLKAALSSTRPPALVVWPEVPAPFYYDEDPQFRNRINQLARAAGASLLVGVVARTPHGAPLNSAVLVSPQGLPLTRYDKIKLVPFGEFVPWPLGGLAKHISTEVGDFQSGTEVVVSPVGAHKIGTFICYESVFPHLVRQFAARGAAVLFNISNDGWFGRSAAREQHLRIVRMRAAENRRWILRSTNDGITAAVDPAGRVRTALPSYVRGALPARFSFVEDQTFYTQHGDWFAVSCALLSIGLLLLCEIDYGSGTRKRLRCMVVLT